MVNVSVFLSDFQTNHSFFSVQVCLLRFCEAMNVGQGRYAPTVLLNSQTFPPSSSGSTNKVSSTKSEEGTYICLSYGKYVQGTIPMMRTKEVDVLEQVQSKDTARRSIQLSRSLNLQNLTSSTKVVPKCVWEVRGIKTIFNDERRPQNV